MLSLAKSSKPLVVFENPWHLRLYRITFGYVQVKIDIAHRLMFLVKGRTGTTFYRRSGEFSSLAVEGPPAKRLHICCSRSHGVLRFIIIRVSPAFSDVRIPFVLVLQLLNEAVLEVRLQLLSLFRQSVVMLA